MFDSSTKQQADSEPRESYDPLDCERSVLLSNKCRTSSDRVLNEGRGNVIEVKATWEHQS